jgi:hypothetical protein
MRSGVVATGLVGVLGAASAATAQPWGGVVPVARTAGEPVVALAGTHLLIGRTTLRSVRLRTAPAAGGPARTLFSMAAPGRPRRLLVMNDLDASPERVVFSLVELNLATEGIVGASVWGGAPDGPFAPLARRRGGAWIPVDVQASGSDAAFTEIRPIEPAARHYMLPAAAEGVRVRVPRGIERVEVAGSLVAFVEAERRIAVRDWATGVERLRYTAGGNISGFDLAADGRALLHVPSRNAVELIDLSGSVTRVGTGGAAADGGVRLAGDQALMRFAGRFEGDAHIAAIDLASGERRRLSPPSLDLGQEHVSLDAEGELVAWAANSCAFAAPVAGPGSSLVPPGPCPRAELHFLDHQPERLRGRTVRVRLRCVTAPPPGCRGTVRLRLFRPLGKARYVIPAGDRETVRVRLTEGGLSALEREFRHPPPVNVAFADVGLTLAGGAHPRRVTPHQGIVIRPGRRALK